MNKISKELFETWLSDYYGLNVYVNPCMTRGVPGYLTTQLPLMLFIGLTLPVPIHDLKVTDSGWSGTLSFNRTPHYVECPFDSIWCVEEPATNSWLYKPDWLVVKEPPSKPEKPVGETTSSNVIAVDFKNRKKK